MYSHSTCGRRTREVRFRLFLTLGRASGRMRSKEIACRIDAPIVLKDSKILVRLNQSSAGYLPPKAAGVTERLRLIAIRLAATELPRRGSLLDDVHDSSVAADGHSIVDSLERRHNGPRPVRRGSDDTLPHVATTSFSDHSIQCHLHRRAIVGRTTSTLS